MKKVKYRMCLAIFLMSQMKTKVIIFKAFPAILSDP